MSSSSPWRVPQRLVNRLRWEDPPDKLKLFPDVYKGAPAVWTEEGRKACARQENRAWSAHLPNAPEIESVAKVRFPRVTLRAIAFVWMFYHGCVSRLAISCALYPCIP